MKTLNVKNIAQVTLASAAFIAASAFTNQANAFFGDSCYDDYDSEYLVATQDPIVSTGMGGMMRTVVGVTEMDNGNYELMVADSGGAFSMSLNEQTLAQFKAVMVDAVKHSLGREVLGKKKLGSIDTECSRLKPMATNTWTENLGDSRVKFYATQYGAVNTVMMKFTKNETYNPDAIQLTDIAIYELAKVFAPEALEIIAEKNRAKEQAKKQAETERKARELAERKEREAEEAKQRELDRIAAAKRAEKRKQEELAKRKAEEERHKAYKLAEKKRIRDALRKHDEEAAKAAAEAQEKERQRTAAALARYRAQQNTTSNNTASTTTDRNSIMGRVSTQARNTLRTKTADVVNGLPVQPSVNDNKAQQIIKNSSEMKAVKDVTNALNSLF